MSKDDLIICSQQSECHVTKYRRTASYLVGHNKLVKLGFGMIWTALVIESLPIICFPTID